MISVLGKIHSKDISIIALKQVAGSVLMLGHETIVMLTNYNSIVLKIFGGQQV